VSGSAVTQLVLHERQARDRGWWGRMRECFAAQSTVRLSWFQGSGADFVSGSERMAGRGDLSRHRLGPPVVDINGDRALAEVSAGIELRTDLAGVEVDLISYARLIYRAQFIDGRWQIVSLDPIYERDSLTPAIPGTVVRLDPAELTGLRSSYRLLAHLLRLRGYDVRDDLYGDDQPETVDAFHRDAQEWLTA
jgi:hypothetical protein